MTPVELRRTSPEDRAALAIALIYGIFASDSSLTLSNQLLPQLQTLEQLTPAERLDVVIQMLQDLRTVVE